MLYSLLFLFPKSSSILFGSLMLRECFCLLTEANVIEKLYSKPNSPVWLFVGAARKAPSPVME